MQMVETKRLAAELRLEECAREAEASLGYQQIRDDGSSGEEAAISTSLAGTLLELPRCELQCQYPGA